jgi:hypothetical protein
VRLFSCTIAGLLMFPVLSLAADDSGSSRRRVLLLGASVGYEWDVPAWPQRMKNTQYMVEMVPEYVFDKAAALEEILMRPRRKFHPTRTYVKGFFRPAPQKPKLLIIKECAAYFPGDLAAYTTVIQRMVTQCLAAGVRPALATVVPVTAEHAARKPGRLEGIHAYNDWVRSYTAAEHIPCFDFEAVVRTDPKARLLKPEFTSGDGLHLNRAAYDALDADFAAMLQAAGQ